MSVQGVVLLYFFISSPYGRQQERIFAALYGLFLITERRIVPMKQLFPRGKRIRPTDKDLVFYTALASLLPVFLLVVLLFHIGQIAGTNWQEVSLSQIVQDVNIPYLLFSMGVAGLVCLTAVLLFWRYRRDEVKQLINRQKLARMVLENKWYESEQRKEDAFFRSHR